ncbi:Kinesin-related protein 11 [Symbiodinium microadriaticum]|uniref:Kinesin-like protein n=1 Tax=Symbiodinium microadriaticum TaxID=2951 RepID=A0A1Q9E4B3_SYMMI|nr:Kinesin-related protein 11 [Symbiodinium microadriaticum]
MLTSGSAAANLIEPGRVSVCCRLRPLLANEVSQGFQRAPWEVTETSIGLRERQLTRAESGLLRDGDGHASAKSLKTRGELRNLDHLRRPDDETVMDHVFGETATTEEVYRRGFREIVLSAAEVISLLSRWECLKHAIHQIHEHNASSLSFEVRGWIVPEDVFDQRLHCGQSRIIHFALEDLFTELQTKASAPGGVEYLVRMSYCELYMERVNDLLRKIGPQSQNLVVKEDPEGRGFYADGLKEKIVSSADEVLAIFTEAEKRRRVAHTRYNEVSSRSHTLLTLCVECSMPLEADAPLGEDNEPAQVTRIGRLVIVDLAGNERLEAGTEYVAESSSINKSLFFLGKVIEKLAARAGRGTAQGLACSGVEHWLTRLLSVHLGGNSRTGLLVTLTPAADAVEQSLTTLRFAQKASQVRCVAKPVLISKEQSLIVKQREIIAQLHSQVRSLQEEVQRSTSSLPSRSGEDELVAERQQCAEQLQALVLSSTEHGRSFVSKSREVDTVVTALHRNMDVLQKQTLFFITAMV